MKHTKRDVGHSNVDNDDGNDGDNDNDNDAYNDDDNDAENDVLYSYRFQYQERVIQCFYSNTDNTVYSCINFAIICALKCTLHNDSLLCIQQIHSASSLHCKCLSEE